MVDGLADFNMSDGLAPLIMQKLNNNFARLADAIKDPEVVITSGAAAPDPRTDETLWYNTETGELSIWAQVVDLDTGELTGEWDWRKLDLNTVTIRDYAPTASMSAYYEPPEGQFLWYDTAHHKLWIWYQSVFASEPVWETFESLIIQTVDYYYFRSTGSGHQRFVNAVKSAVDE